MQTVIPGSCSTYTVDSLLLLVFETYLTLKAIYRYLRRHDELWDLSTLHYIASELYSMIQGRTRRCTGAVRAYRRFTFRTNG